MTQLITPPSGRSLVIPGFFGSHLPQASGFHSAKQILVASLANRLELVSVVTIIYITPPTGGKTTAGSNAPGDFLVFLIAFYSIC